MALLPPSPPSGHRSRGREALRGLGLGARIWLLRHGEVEASAARFAYGDSEVPLSAAGLERTRELERLFRGVNLARVISSPLGRARLLGEALARASGTTLEIDERLNEMQRGAWQGLELEEYRRRWQAQAGKYWEDPWRWRGHGGESDEQLTQRTWPAFEDTLESGGSVVLTIHGQVLRSIVAAALGLQPGYSHGLCNRTGHGTLLFDGPRGFELVRSNATPHPELDPDPEPRVKEVEP